ncbi:UvrD-helicase domain-containing protein [Nocardiopsis aegyptia]|uniref:DNA helicase-2/ATP-dependent DNA helicase PcrA n=1 Tax=Nocardiopsis aegyptia TaxID=220378 RepID=A0A7Z0J8T0_9ACTN|nr:UvrD-helicase domain-containing protein [Nocardiopsis aegyptia]NYJ33047.1 DNA helicase-2/ATP-dependent DNA helicase PcrA [Nocardiopsis aegyptia]
MKTGGGHGSTEADEQITSIIDDPVKRAFVVIAGAGSGKTASLVKALRRIGREQGTALRGRRRRVACITYTNAAVEEITARVDADPLFHVSTIHSFLWGVVSPFQGMIRAWVREDIDRVIEQRSPEAAAKYVEARERLDGHAPRFSYQPTRDYRKGFLGHNEILRMVPEMIIGYPRLAAIVAQSFPYVLVDESQDTDPRVVEALKYVEYQERGRFCVGFFGDPMQRIYLQGSGLVTGDETWTVIRKRQNWRCPPPVLRVINHIRGQSPQDGDLQQVLGEEEGHSPRPGYADLFVLPSAQEDDSLVDQVRDHLAVREGDALWSQGTDGQHLKILVLEHRLAALRLGFEDLDSAFRKAKGRTGEQLRDEYIKGTHWSLKPVLDRLIPLVEAVEDRKGVAALAMLRSFSPRLHTFMDGDAPAQTLTEVKEATDTLTGLLASDSQEPVVALLRYALREGIIPLDPRLKSHLSRHDDFDFLEGIRTEGPEPDDEPAGPTEETRRDRLAMLAEAMGFFLACPAGQLRAYHDYLRGRSPYGTQHGVKGAEFERVLVLLEDHRSKWNKYSYEKLLGLREPSDADRRNIGQEKEDTAERTRKLFYVACSRATRSLAVVMFTKDPDTAIRRLRESDDCPFPAENIHGMEDLLVRSM